MIKIYTTCSGWLKTKTGVSQRYVLGPLFFNILFMTLHALLRSQIYAILQKIILTSRVAII